jgi:hypothetical protein
MVTAAGRQIGRWTNRQTDGLAGGQIDRGIGKDIKGYKRQLDEHKEQTDK